MNLVNLSGAKNPRTVLVLLAFILAIGLGYLTGIWIIDAMRDGRIPNWFTPHETIILETGPRTAIEVRGDEPQRGSSSALVTIIEFADFECSACAEASAPLESALERHEDLVRVVFKHYPLPRHDRALAAAYAAWAAHRQSKFWPLAEALFERKGNLEDLPELVVSLGLDGPRFWQDMKSTAAHDAIEGDRLAGGQAQIRGTPTFFVNGHRYVRRWDRETWDAVIEHEAKAARELLEQGIAAEHIYTRLIAEDPTP